MDWKISLNWWIENQGFFPSHFTGLSCMHNTGLFAPPVICGVIGTYWESGAHLEVGNKMICEAFSSEIPLERSTQASGSAPGAVKSENQKRYRTYLLFCCPFYPSQSRKPPTVRAPGGLRAKRSRLPLAVHVLLLLIKNVLAAFVERIRMQCSCLFLSVLLDRDRT